MSLNLTKRLVKNAPLTALEGDNNLTKVDQAIGDLQSIPSVFPAVDEVTLHLAAGTLSVKSGGVGTTQLGAGVVTSAKVSADAILPTNVASAAVAVASASNSTPVDWSLTNSFYTTLTENTTFVFSNTKEGQTISVAVVQHASAAKTVAWPTVKWLGGVAPTMTATVSRTDVYTFVKINGIFYGGAMQNCF